MDLPASEVFIGSIGVYGGNGHLLDGGNTNRARSTGSAPPGSICCDRVQMPLGCRVRFSDRETREFIENQLRDHLGADDFYKLVDGARNFAAPDE